MGEKGIRMEHTKTEGAVPASGERVTAPGSGRAAGSKRRGAMHDRVAARLRQALMAGQFMPGETISLRRLARGLGTSAMPVREAINELTAAGALETLPNRTVAVPRMSKSEFVELTRIRIALEGMAAEEACRQATPQVIRQLKKTNTELHKAIHDGDYLASLAKNQEFHFRLYAASKSALLPRLIEALWLRAGPFMYFSLISPATPWDASNHSDVIAALETADTDGARAAIERDINGTAEYLLQKSAVFRDDFGLLGSLED